MTEKVCIKVKNLRKLGYANLREWMEDENNLYVGRHGRIFIEGKIFHYTGSKWGNPFKSKDFESIDECLMKYEDHVYESGLIDDIYELEGKKLGCFCETESCHASVLCRILEEMNFVPEKK